MKLSDDLDERVNAAGTVMQENIRFHITAEVIGKLWPSLSRENRRLSELKLLHCGRDMVEFAGFSASPDNQTYFDSAIQQIFTRSRMKSKALIQDELNQPLCCQATLRKDPLNRKLTSTVRSIPKGKPSDKSIIDNSRPASNSEIRKLILCRKSQRSAPPCLAK
ncbi:hypothetical protein T4A_12766 [Trichinella pseudospiralis]|uniref:Uncharacterized protein n=1 Tax=Trichinella pseudospiralis TaxID=6337 RepID=A0A0V1E2G5_TRIPS|nr:hypothetical protein T4A_12766 [Trichinella pseudospiralis]